MVEINNKTKIRIDKKMIEKVVTRFLKQYKKSDYEVSIAFLSSPEMKKINKIYRGVDKTTDVLSFEGEEKFFGEILIDPKQIKKQAQAEGNTFKGELIFILVHGLLHLIGYDDDTEKKRLEMIKIGGEFIKISKL